ncbi:MAG: alpha/beta hydrolase [Caldilineaceae bacterium]
MARMLMDKMHLRQQLISRVGVPMQDETVVADNLQTRYLAVGKGKPVLLLHGATAGGAISWHPLFKPISTRFRVIAPDCPGYGESAIEQVVHDVPFFVHWLDSFLDKLQVEKIAVIGASQGGSIAMRYALYRPQRVHKLVLIASAGLCSRLRYSVLLFALGSLLLDLCPAPVLERAFERALIFQSETNNPTFDLYRRYNCEIANLPAFQSISWLQRIFHINRPLTRDELSQIGQPTLLLWSAKDRLFPTPIAYTAAKVIPNAQLHIVPNTGHAAFLEDPKQFLAAIMPFLAGKLPKQKLGEPAKSLFWRKDHGASISPIHL